MHRKNSLTMKKYNLVLFLIFLSASSWAQSVLRVLPQLSVDAGTYDDRVSVAVTFPEGCVGGKYWVDGGEIKAKNYDGPILVDYSCSLSVAGTDARGRIITDVVTRDYDIRRVTPPSVTPIPQEGVRTENFYVTRLQWNNVTRVDCDLTPFKEGGERRGEYVVWLTGPDGSVISGGDANNLWIDGLNCYKIYIYRQYTPEEYGTYVLHVAPGVFILDGKRYADELQFRYEVAPGSSKPTFSPAEGEYKGSVTVSINYPTDGSAFVKIYSINGGKAKQYTAPFVLTETSTIEAYGMDEEFTDQTPSAFATYTILPADPAPAVLPAPAVTCSAGTVSISAPEGATVKYWYNSRMSTAQIYSAPFTVDSNCRISCVAYTDDAVSPTVDFEVADIPENRGDNGELILVTPVTTETAHLRAISPNGRYAAGYMGSDTSSKGFVWDLESDILQYASTVFVGQLWYVNDEGVAWGWRARSMDIDENMTDDDILWGTFKDGVWTEMPLETYAPSSLPVAPDGYPAATLVSHNGEWAVLGNMYRWHLTTSTIERLISTTDRYHDGARPEVLSCICDNGLIFGTYDDSFFSPEKGIGLVYTLDGRWRNVVEWMEEECGLKEMDGYTITSVRDVTPDGRTFLFHATERGMAVENTFTRGVVLCIDVPVHHLAPVAVKAEQLNGLEVVKVQWNAPITEADQVKSYTVARDGEVLGEVDADTFVFYDEQVSDAATYSYTVAATYADGRKSEMSRGSSVTCHLLHHLPARHLSYRPVGLSSLCLNWEPPVVSLPKLQYFGEENETFAFGTNNYNAEFGIRIPASDLISYEGQQIRTFQFLPTGPQSAYVLNLYKGSTEKNGTYDDMPFYSQEIDPASLNYGSVNTIEIADPQELPQGSDLYVALYIKSRGNDDMLGISYEGFRSGYTDLCRIVGVHDKMVAISKNSKVTTEIVLPLGIGICTEDTYNACIVGNYEVRDNGSLVATTSLTRTTIADVCEGEHEFSVTTLYRDGRGSAPVTTSMVMHQNEAAFVPVEVSVDVASDGAARLNWQAPRDDDRTLIHWGDLTPCGGWPAPDGIYTFAAIAAYPVEKTAPFVGDYEVTDLFFYPMAQVRYNVALSDGTVEFVSIEPENVKLNEINFIRLPEPIEVEPSVMYNVVVNAMGVTKDVVALGYDSSGKWQNGYSNLVNYGFETSTLADFVQIDEHPNWLIGMVVRQKDAPLLPVEGYDVRIDGESQGNDLLTDTEYVSAPLAEGEHRASVDVVYTVGKKVKGADVPFVIGLDGINRIEGADSFAQCYDLSGRRVLKDREDRGIFIISNQKIKR